MQRVKSIEKFLQKLKISSSGNLSEVDTNLVKIQNTRRLFFEKIAEECKKNIILREWATFGLYNDIDKHLKHHNESDVLRDIQLIANSYCIRNDSKFLESVTINDVLVFHYNEIKNTIGLENLKI